MFSATDSTVIAAWISLAGVFVATGGGIVLALVKMSRSNSKDHGEVLTVLRTVVMGQEQLTNVVDRHIDHHDQIRRHEDLPARNLSDR
jgi:shikimate kinase